ncbi:HTH domain-containing protein [Kineosporia sp. NBRC 101731]|uniref:helix-turn-helix transcriptional regulator n=1 Tax=Kineosporia sp. NBRC 101731 TaxID=3032199 RepID=UPI0024A21E78|nr:HTH domain-containing protein [Kineosporia sp. NBRC 101731]GLY29250.1 hypothetical protein Kisp02_26150 [Kineosporia sp. NBRC 101731]
MKRAERQYALVDLLRGARRPWSAARLAAEFGVSSRTIERDIGSLQSAGVPIYADHGAAGGYSILREYSLPPLNLSAAESLAVLAGLALLESSPYQGAARRARAKIVAVMAELQPHIVPAPAPVTADRLDALRAEDATEVPPTETLERGGLFEISERTVDGPVGVKAADLHPGRPGRTASGDLPHARWRHVQR